MSDNYQIINVDAMMEAKSLMGDRFPTMVTYFFEDTNTYFQEIKRAISEKKYEIAKGPSHTIKSSAKQMGADKVSEIARVIEEMCDTCEGEFDFDRLEKLCVDLEAEINSAKPEMEKLA